MDPLSAMRMTAAGRITPFNPPVIDQLPPELAGQMQKVPADELKKLGNVTTPQLQAFAPASVPGGRGFADFLGEMARDVNAKQATATQTIDGMMTGESVPLHQAVLAVEEASVSFQLMVEVRNKLLESYQELMRMQI